VKSAGEKSCAGLAGEGLESQASAKLNNNRPAAAMTSLRFMNKTIRGACSLKYRMMVSKTVIKHQVA
jgi:hypothetical protein